MSSAEPACRIIPNLILLMEDGVGLLVGTEMGAWAQTKTRAAIRACLRDDGLRSDERQIALPGSHGRFLPHVRHTKLAAFESMVKRSRLSRSIDTTTTAARRATAPMRVLGIRKSASGPARIRCVLETSAAIFFAFLHKFPIICRASCSQWFEDRAEALVGAQAACAVWDGLQLRPSPNPISHCPRRSCQSFRR